MLCGVLVAPVHLEPVLGLPARRQLILRLLQRPSQGVLNIGCLIHGLLNIGCIIHGLLNIECLIHGVLNIECLIHGVLNIGCLIHAL
jgi:hypothetical protein